MIGDHFQARRQHVVGRVEFGTVPQGVPVLRPREPHDVRGVRLRDGKVRMQRGGEGEWLRIGVGHGQGNREHRGRHLHRQLCRKRVRPLRARRLAVGQAQQEPRRRVIGGLLRNVPPAEAGEAMLGEGAERTELRKANGDAAADGTPRTVMRGATHEEPVVARAAGYPRRHLPAVEIHPRESTVGRV